MRVLAWVTGTRVEFADDGSEDYAEEHGWVDWNWSHHDLHPSRNDVRPVAEWDDRDADDLEDFPTVADFIRGTVETVLGAAEGNGDGSWWSSVDEHLCSVTLEDGSSWSYSVHFTHKRYDSARGWVEDTVTPDYVSPDA